MNFYFLYTLLPADKKGVPAVERQIFTKFLNYFVFLFGSYIYVTYICSVIIKQLENMTTQRPIGQLKSKVTVYCETCGCSSKRNLKEFVYENTPEKIKEAQDKIKVKAEKEYTCRICKSIKKDLIS